MTHIVFQVIFFFFYFFHEILIFCNVLYLYIIQRQSARTLLALYSQQGVPWAKLYKEIMLPQVVFN